jgi:RND family efflux transporter MFP subunit
MKAKLISLAVPAALACLTACSRGRDIAASALETVRGAQVVKLQEQTVPNTFAAVGTVRAARTAPLSAQVMGTITAVNVHEGDPVKRGQVLVTLDDAQPRAAVEQAEAAVSAADHEMSATESELALAQITFNRMQALYDKKSLSPQEYDEGRTRLQSATARRDMARAARGQAEAAFDQARTHLDHTRVHAPFDGIVTERRVDPGALAAPGVPLLTVEAGGQYRLEAAVDERDLTFVRLGQPVVVSLDTWDGQPLSGKVAQIVPAADPASRSFTVKIDLPPNKNLRSGVFGRASFFRGTRQAVFIPQSAASERGQLQIVYVVGTNNIAALRYVTLGAEQQQGREVLSGLSPGEVVVASPAGRNLAGKRIEAP